MLTRFPVFESIVSFLNVTSSVSMNLNPFMVFKRSSRCDSVSGLVFVNGLTDLNCLGALSHPILHDPLELDLVPLS